MANQRRQTHCEHIWITGASSGIGRHLAIKLANLGHRVIISARNRQALEEMASEHEGLIPLAVDVAAPGAKENACRRLAQLTPRLDRIILSAGCCEYFDVDRPDWQMMERVMSVNYFGAVNSIAAALPLMGANGHIVAMASQASRVPFPRAQAYGASKAALTYLLESLGVDLHSKGIDVTVVQLGFVDTPMTADNDFPMPFLMSAEAAADQLLRQLSQRPRFIRFPRRLSWMISLGQKMPGLWYRYIAPRLSRAQEEQQRAGTQV
jgi:short-subunit dehydrogenase